MEPNDGLNTIDGCEDGLYGTYGYDESVNKITVSSVDAPQLESGQVAQISAEWRSYGTASEFESLLSLCSTCLRTFDPADKTTHISMQALLTSIPLAMRTILSGLSGVVLAVLWVVITLLQPSLFSHLDRFRPSASKLVTVGASRWMIPPVSWVVLTIGMILVRKLSVHHL